VVNLLNGSKVAQNTRKYAVITKGWNKSLSAAVVTSPTNGEKV
jgi:hypothetical protein